MFALATSAGCGAEDDAPAPRSSSAAVANGHEDTADEFSFVVHLATPYRQCSGVLVSPGVVMTARHCVVGDNADCLGQPANGPPMDLSGAKRTIHIGPDWTTPKKTIEYTGKNGPIVLGKGGSHAPVDSCSKNDSSTDIAFIPLDERVPLDLAKPMHLPMNGFPSCNDVAGDYFEATVIGFGHTQAFPWASGIDPTRTFHDSGGSFTDLGWHREESHPCCGCKHGLIPEEDLDGAVYSAYWGPEYLTSYDALAQGDSGGALVTKGVFPAALAGGVSPLEHRTV